MLFDSFVQENSTGTKDRLLKEAFFLPFFELVPSLKQRTVVRIIGVVPSQSQPDISKVIKLTLKLHIVMHVLLNDLLHYSMP
jgi:hypothetical protein